MGAGQVAQGELTSPVNLPKKELDGPRPIVLSESVSNLRNEPGCAAGDRGKSFAARRAGPE